ncbi:LL-diaminopimelate aminotransferase [Paenibacillus psychroresistens]|uniref:Aminotransferase n=1 Tax=Paenibacillus psychroresistens TaxID=1778678 RepID=A0A6B8RLT2_9BACL|nr:LL-diaminopimelate aminotransferase [Paenibacillus psychroresistens]QGQ96714.1 LL-diaminopimelate aminotransferase [Paenibacillus psychroresistens]
MSSYIQNLFAARIGGRQFGQDEILYKFEKIKQAKREAVRLNPHIILLDFGVGEPDWMADEPVINILADEASKWENRGYADNGSLAFKEAAAMYMESTFGVRELDPLTEINHCIGSKSALAQLPAAFINEGDITLRTAPGYEIIGTHTEWMGGEVYLLPLLAENQFLPNLSSIPENIKKRAKLLYLNYPNNPTGATATKAFYEEVVQFARDNQVIVVSDEAYSGLTFDNELPLSFLSIQGAKEVGISIHSLSKAFNMTGWRLGFIAGNERIIHAIKAVKDNYDSGQFMAIQKAGVYCLNHPEITKATNAKYSRRHDLLTNVLNGIGFKAVKPKGSFFQYVEAPRGLKAGITFNTAEDFSQYLITDKLISTVPWDDAGKYIRFSVTYTATIEQEVAVMEELKSRLCHVPFIW